MSQSQPVSRPSTPRLDVDAVLAAARADRRACRQARDAAAAYRRRPSSQSGAGGDPATANDSCIAPEPTAGAGSDAMSRIQHRGTNSPMISNSSGAPVLNSGQRMSSIDTSDPKWKIEYVDDDSDDDGGAGGWITVPKHRRSSRAQGSSRVGGQTAHPRSHGVDSRKAARLAARLDAVVARGDDRDAVARGESAPNLDANEIARASETSGRNCAGARVGGTKHQSSSTRKVSSAGRHRRHIIAARSLATTHTYAGDGAGAGRMGTLSLAEDDAEGLDDECYTMEDLDEIGRDQMRLETDLQQMVSDCDEMLTALCDNDDLSDVQQLVDGMQEKINICRPTGAGRPVAKPPLHPNGTRRASPRSAVRGKKADAAGGNKSR
eukprot:SAG31_NODE_3088_length_4690_cov_2.363973_6_plen_379_part_00